MKPTPFLAAVWQVEMLAINRRLGHLVDYVIDALQASDQLAQRYSFAEMVGRSWELRQFYPSLKGGTEWDNRLTQIVQQEWLPAVNALVQEKIGRGLSSHDAIRFFCEMNMMRSPNKAEMRQFDETYWEAHPCPPVATFGPRLTRLYDLHCRLASDDQLSGDQLGEHWDDFRSRQLKSARTELPKATNYDLSLLNAFLGWRALIHERVVYPALERIGRSGTRDPEDFMSRTRDVMGLAEGTFSW